MARLETYTCDGKDCDAIKKKSNHWWDVIVCSELVSDNPKLVIQPHKHPITDNTKTFCGIECAMKYISQWMASLQSSSAGS